jgi:hypothetical protein
MSTDYGMLPEITFLQRPCKEGDKRHLVIATMRRCRVIHTSVSTANLGGLCIWLYRAADITGMIKH